MSRSHLQRSLQWDIETMFQELEAHLHSEINTLGYPKAALFGFCVALVAYNVLAVVKAALRTMHGEETIDNELSGYYLAGNITRTHDGMMIALPESEWLVFQTMPLPKLAEVLLQLAGNVNLSKFRKSRRGTKKNLQSATNIQTIIMSLRQNFSMGKNLVSSTLKGLPPSRLPHRAITQGQGGWPALPCMTFSVTPPCQINLARPRLLHKFSVLGVGYQEP